MIEWLPIQSGFCNKISILSKMLSLTAGSGSTPRCAVSDVRLFTQTCAELACKNPVSYTHLDVYKRQGPSHAGPTISVDWAQPSTEGAYVGAGLPNLVRPNLCHGKGSRFPTLDAACRNLGATPSDLWRMDHLHRTLPVLSDKTLSHSRVNLASIKQA